MRNDENKHDDLMIGFPILTFNLRQYFFFTVNGFQLVSRLTVKVEAFYA